MELLLPGIFSLLIGIFPVLLIFLDYHKKHNIHKALVFILSFFALLFIFVFVLLPLFSYYIALAIPVFLALYLIIAKK